MSLLGSYWHRPILGENQGRFEEIKEKIKKYKATLENGNPKRIQRRLRTTQNSQRKLKMLRMASVDRERENFQSSQNSVKIT
jgi:hypothetical protein